MKPVKSVITFCGTLLAIMVLTTVPTRVLAGPVYSAFGNYTVEVLQGSTAYADELGFNGNATTFRHYGRQGPGPGGHWFYDTVRIQYIADPGYVFTDAGMSFGQWGYFNTPFTGGYQHWLQWRIAGSTYEGGSYASENFGNTSLSLRGVAWQGSGDGGSSYHYDFQHWSGGGGLWKLFVDEGTPINLNGMSSFTIELDMQMLAYATSGFTADLVVTVNSTLAPANVPEPGTLALLMAGLALIRRSQVARQL